MKCILSFFTVIILTTNVFCHISKPKTSSYGAEIWSNTPSSKTDKIKISTNLSSEGIKEYFVRWFYKARFISDTAVSFSPLRSDIIKRDNFYFRIFVDFSDSIAIIHGVNGNLGLNAALQHLQPLDHNMIWKPIIFNSRGWEAMNSVGVSSQIGLKVYNNP